MIAEAIVKIMVPLALIKNDVRCTGSVSVVVVAVVSERAACEVVLGTVSSDYKSCVTGISVELSLKLVYIVGVCSNSVLSLSNVTEVVALLAACLLVSNGVKSVAVDCYCVLFCKVLFTFLTCKEGLEGEVCEINLFVAYEGKESVEVNNFLFFVLVLFLVFNSDLTVSLCLENGVLLCGDGVKVKTKEYVVNSCRSCEIAGNYSSGYAVFGFLNILNVCALSHRVKLSYGSVVVLTGIVRIVLNGRIYTCTVNGYSADVIAAVFARGSIELEGVDSYGFLKAVSEYVVVRYGRTVVKRELCTVVRIVVAHRARKALTVGSTCCATSAVVTNAEGRALVGHRECVKRIYIVMIVVVEYVSISRKLVISCVCIAEQNVVLFSLGCTHRNDCKHGRKKHRN